MAIAVILFHWKTLLTKQFTLIDGSEGVNMDWAWLHFMGRSLRAGRLPLWDPYQFAGIPFAGSMQPALYYPVQLVLSLLPLTRQGYLSSSFFHQSVALTHLLGAWFCFALLRELGRSQFASFVGGLTFALSGIAVGIIWPLYIDSCIWLPAIFLFLLRALRSTRWERAALESLLCGLCLAMSIFTGGMVFVIMQGLFVVGAVAFRVATQPAKSSFSRQDWCIRGGLILSVSIVFALGLSAIQLLPAREFGQATVRFIDGGAFPSSEKIPFGRLVPGVWPQSIVSLLFPFGFDGKYGGEEYYAYYIGVLPFGLALIAIWKCWKSLWVRFLSFTALFGFVYALGEISPLYGVMYALVPLLWMGRGGDRFSYLVTFSLAVLSAFGLDVLIDRESTAGAWDRARPFIKWTAICAGAALVIPGLFPQLHLNIWNALSLLLIIATCGWFGWLLSHSPRTSTRVLLAVFILFDLTAFNWVEKEIAGPGKPDEQLLQMYSLRGPAEFVKRQPGLHRVKVAVEPRPNIGDVYGVEGDWGGGAAVLTEYSKLGSNDDLLNIAYVIKPASAAEPGDIYHDAKWKVYANANAFPRAWIVHRAFPVESQDAAFQSLDTHDLRHQAVVEGTAAPLSQPRNPDIESVRYRSWTPERFSIDATATSEGMVVLSEMYYPGWRATVNGKPSRVLRVDGALRGVLVAPGPNVIEMEYAPVTFSAGAAISLATIVLSSVVCFVLWKRLKALPGYESV